MPIVPVNVEDIDARAPWPSGLRRVSRLREYVTAERVVWWRRQPHGPAHPPLPTHPKWHVFTGRTAEPGPPEGTTFTWTALCGYQNTRSDILGDNRSFTVVMPRKTFRCHKCDEALHKLKHQT